MSTPLRLGLYGLGLLVLFAAAFVTAQAVVSPETVSNWTGNGGHDDHANGHNGHADHGGAPSGASLPAGLSLEQDGYVLSAVSVPATASEEATLSFQVSGPGGRAVTDYETPHEKELHLIVVRSDGTHFRHAHPTGDGWGGWSIPWTWEAAGTYRLYVDFVPAELGEAVTLSQTVDVAGSFEPSPPGANVTRAQAGDYEVELRGRLVAGSSSRLSFSVSNDGEPVTALQPYLGAFGHLVALRQGDMAYLHVHAEGEPSHASATSGPEIQFTAEAPTPGAYLLYLDFQVGDTVYTAAFTLTAV